MPGKCSKKLWLAAVLLVALAALPSTGTAAEITAASEDELIGTLQGNAAWTEKQEACRALRQRGTAQSVPALAVLLTDPQLSSLARYALESMASPEAADALRDALGRTQGMLTAGMATSLGVLRDDNAVPLLVPLLNTPDLDVARAAAGALGRIANADAIHALQQAAPQAPPALRIAVLEGLLAAAGRLRAQDRGEEAAPLYELLVAKDYPQHVRMGAWYGRARAIPAQTSEWVHAALAGEEDAFRNQAAQVVAETSGAQETLFYAEALPKLPAAGQAALLRGLADRGDAAARPAILQQVTENENPEVRLAAVRALGKLGNENDVPDLIALLNSADTAIADAATVSLTLIPGTPADEKIAVAVPESAPAARAVLLGVLANRAAAQTVLTALQALLDTDAEVRIAALDVLARYARGEQTQPVLERLLQSSGKELAAAEKTLTAIAAQAGDEVLPMLQNAMPTATTDLRLVLLNCMARIRTASALDAIADTVDSPEPPLSSAALNHLSNWPTLDAAPRLLALAKSDDPSRHVLGLRGYVRLAQAETAPETKTTMLNEAMALVRNADEKKQVIAAWASLKNGAPYPVLQPLLDEEAVRNEAGWALVSISKEVCKQGDEGRKVATTALNLVIQKCPDASLQDAAKAALKEIP